MITLFAVAFGVILFTTVSAVRPTTDKALASQFTKQRHEWERLVSIIQSNSNIASLQRHSQSNGVLIGRHKAGRPMLMSEIGSSTELLRLFDLLGCDYASQSDDEINVAFRRNGIEDLYPGGYKVIVIRSNRPTFIVNSIDEFRRENRGIYRYYRHLEGPWYIK